MRVGRKPFVEEIKNEGKQQHDDQDHKNRPETRLSLCLRLVFMTGSIPGSFQKQMNRLSPGPGGMPERLPSEFHRDQ
jgi:hypothetical protein